MKVIIPMAGYGSRMRPHTYSRPKPLVNIVGQPMLDHLLATLDGLDIDQYIFIVGYLGDQIEEFIQTNYDLNAVFVTQEELIGQAHAVYLAREYIEGPTILLFSDTLFQADLSIIKTTNADGVAFVKEVEDPRRFGVVDLNKDGFITRFIEKPDSMENKNAVIGLYYLREGKDMITAIETQMARNQMTKGEFYIADAYQIMIEEGASFVTQNVDVWLDCGKPETVLETNRYMLDHGFDNSSAVHHPGTTILSPSFVAPDAKVEQSVIGPYATVSAGCEVKTSIIRNSIMDVGAKVDNSLLDQSLIGQHATVSGRMRIVNVGDDSTVGFN